MKKLLITTILVLCFVNALYADTTEHQLIDEIVSQVDTEELRLIVEQLSGAKPLDDGSFIATRRIGTEGNEKAADYIAEQYSDIGNLNIKVDSFNTLGTQRLVGFLFKLLVFPTLDPDQIESLLDQLDKNIAFIKNNNIRRSENILAILRGETRQIVFSAAHYDSIVLNLDPFEIIEDVFAPGADDNATGVAATIMAARILSQYQLTNSICFMNPAAEELGMLGSISYVLQHILGLKRIKSVINIDMIGYDHDSDGLLNVSYGENSMKDVVSEEYNSLGLDIDPVLLSIESLLNTEYPNASDHFSFYMFGGVDRAVSFTEGFWTSETELDFNEANVGYHKETDTIDNINFPYMTEIVKLYVATLAREAGVIGKR